MKKFSSILFKLFNNYYEDQKKTFRTYSHLDRREELGLFVDRAGGVGTDPLLLRHEDCRLGDGWAPIGSFVR